MFFNWGLPFPIAEYSADLFWLHSFVSSLLFGVFIFVCFILLGMVLSESYFNTPSLAYRKTEVLSLLIPISLLFLQLYYSLDILYRITELDVSPDITIKVVGHQWYWSYEISDLEDVVFDSFMLIEDELLPGDPRLLSVDTRLVVPIEVSLRMCITSADVIHSWALPASGVKVDAVPGILNCVTIFFPILGVFYGQCSEICGSSHSFMPVCVETSLWETWLYWLELMALS